MGHSGDMVCKGTISDPCYAYINFTANEDIFLYPTGYDPYGRNLTFQFDPNVKDWKLQRSWGTGWRNIPLDNACTGTWCGLSNAKDTREFSMAFRKGNTYQIRIVGYKVNSWDTIKWSAFDGEIDPTWYGVPDENTPIDDIVLINDTHQYVYDPESKTWIIVPINPEESKGGGEEVKPVEEKPLPSSKTNTYSLSFAKDITVTATITGNNVNIKDGQGGDLNIAYTGVTSRIQQIPDGVEIFFEKTLTSLDVASVKDAVPKFTTTCNKPDVCDRLNWEVVKREYSKPIVDDRTKEIISYDVKPQSYTYSVKVIDNLTREYTVSLDSKYTDLKLGDKLVIDPIYSISNISLNTQLNQVVCEGGGQYCHLEINDSSLRLYLPFDINHSSLNNVTYDFTSYNNDGTVKGNAQYVQGKWGGAYNFTTAGRKITFPAIALGANGNNWTISAWVNHPGQSGTWNMIINKGDIGYGMSISSAPNSYLAWYGAVTGASVTAVPTNQWAHVAITKNSTIMSFYVNGINGTRFTETSTFSPDSIGDDNYNEIFEGSVDEVMIFNRTLGDGEMLSLYNSQKQKFYSTGNQTVKPVSIITETTNSNRVDITINHSNQLNTNLSMRIGYINKSINNMSDLVLYMPFEWNSPTAWDISGNNNDGTLTGFDGTSVSGWNATGGLNSTGAYNFEHGDDNVIDISSRNLRLTNNTALSWWVYSNTSLSLGQPGFFSYTSGAAFDEFIGAHTGDTFYIETNHEVAWIPTNIGFVANKWIHFVLTINSTGTMFLYANGVSKGSNYDGGYIRLNFIGRGYGSATSTLNGTMDEIMFFNRSLSSTEIQSLYLNQSSKFQNIAYSEYKNMSNGVEREFNISPNTGFIFTDFSYNPDSYSFWSSVLLNPITLETWTFTESGEPPVDNPPYYTVNSNSTNSTEKGTDIQHRLQWNDGTGLSGYIFSFLDGTQYVTGQINDDWTTIGQNVNHTGVSESITGPKTNTTLWKINITGTSDNFGGATVYDGVLYFTGKDNDNTGTLYYGWNRTFAINATTGEKLWNYSTGSADDQSTYYMGKLFVQSSSNSNERLWCLNATTGVPIWNYSFNGAGAYFNGPAIGETENLVYVSATNATSNLYAFNITTGALKWTSPTCYSTSVSSATYYLNRVFVPCYTTDVTKPGLFAFNATTGVQLWNSTPPTNGRGSWDSAVTIYNNTLYLGLYSGNASLRAYQLNGSVIWTTYNLGALNVASILTTPSIRNDAVWVGGTSNSMFKVNATTGIKICNYTTGDDVYSSAAISDNVVYFGSTDDIVYAINESNCSLVWKYTTHGEVVGQAIVANNIFYIASDDWYFYAFGNSSSLWINDSFVPMKGNLNWSNVTKSVPDTLGLNISWRVYVNDSSNQWNASEIFTYTLTSGTVSTCTYSSGNWNVNCADNCNSGNVNLNNNNITIDGIGTFKANLTNFGSIKVTSASSCIAWISY